MPSKENTPGNLTPLAPPTESGWYVVEWVYEDHDPKYDPEFEDCVLLSAERNEWYRVGESGAESLEMVRFIRWARLHPAAYLDAATKEGER